VEARISGLPVVDADGAVLGVVSEADILHKERLGPPRRGGLLGLLLAGDAITAELKLLARTAEEAMTAPAITMGPRRPIAEAATRIVIFRTLWLAPEELHVNVVDGDVTLRGRVETQTEAELLEQLVHRVPGVISLSVDLTWDG
jgi:CBS domain-containing protein